MKEDARMTRKRFRINKTTSEVFGKNSEAREKYELLGKKIWAAKRSD
jgi:hypothetical protein